MNTIDLRESPERFSTVLAALNVGVVIHGPDTAILEANSRARDLLGIQDLHGRLATDPAWVFLDQNLDRLPLERYPVVRVIAGDSVKGEVVLVRRPDGAIVWGEVSALPRLDASGELVEVVVTFVDVTERELRSRDSARLNEELTRLSVTDSLTGLANRRGIFHEAERARASAVRHEDHLSLVIVDLDGFKSVNDQYGHQRGDELLVDVANSIRAQLRAEDLAGRIGGDEFLIVLPRTDLAGAVVIAERLRAAITGTTAASSVGVASLRQRETIREVVSRADRALYDAKQRGGNSVVLNR